jgi:hypothetical protein
MHVLDPSHEAVAAGVELAARLDSLKGKTVGFVSNGKEGTIAFFSHLERLLREQCEVADVQLLTKGNYSAPAEVAILAQTVGWDVAFTGLGD